MSEYEAGLKAMREKTERLRSLRLAHEAAEAETKRAADALPTAKKKAAKKATKSAKKAAANADEPAEAIAAE
jgi:hypothetical protein